MFPTGAYNQVPMGFQYPGQQPPLPPPSIYQSQYAGFNPTPFQQVPPPSRGQSLPASVRHYPPANGPYASISSRQNGQYPPPAPPSLNHGHHTHGSKKHHKQRSVSPNGAADQSLYSDKEKDDRSGSHSPGLGSQTKEEETNQNQEQNSQSAENASAEVVQSGTNAAEEQQQSSQEKEKRKSRSKKKKHHRYEQYHQQYQPIPTPPFYGELPPQMRVHQQPLYSGYNQAFEESIRRGEAYQRQAKRSARLPPEVKKQLLPHEDDQQKQYPFAGYPQQPFRPPFNPYQPGFYPQSTPYNTPQPWSNVGGINPNPAEQEIQRLRSHIHTLEGELHKLQKKLNKASIHHEENQRSPRQTPVIVELNNAEANRESTSKKKHHHRKGSSQNPAPPSGENATDQNASNQQQQTDLQEHSHSGGNQIPAVDAKPPPKSSREETAAQLAHAAAAHVNARQQVPAPPPVQQHYPYQQGVFPPPQPQQIHGQTPRLPFPGNVQHPIDPYQQRNFNQSNNNDLVDKQEERRNRRSADKILDAFERFYMKKSTTTPMKVKYIPEDTNSNHQRNTNNNNNNNNGQDGSTSQNSSPSN